MRALGAIAAAIGVGLAGVLVMGQQAPVPATAQASNPATAANGVAPTTVTASTPTLYHLAATPKTVAWGYYDAAAVPVLKIKSGDRVEVDTLLTNSPGTLVALGVPKDQIEQSLVDITNQVHVKGPGGHILTGPIFVEDAEPGDVLEVRIEKVKLAIGYAYNSFTPTSGILTDDFKRSKGRIVPLDREKMVGHFAEGIDVPLRPFFGSMGVAPDPSAGKISSVPPGTHAGNLDNKELVAGTTLYIPVHAPGALFEVGDGHAAQGDGEVDITALETSLTGTFQFIVRKDMKLAWPRGETPTHIIAMGIDKDLTQATKIAVRQAIAYLVTDKKMTPEDAYMLVSVAGDVHVTQLVDQVMGVHVMIPKEIFVKKAGE